MPPFTEPPGKRGTSLEVKQQVRFRVAAAKQAQSSIDFPLPYAAVMGHIDVALHDAGFAGSTQRRRDVRFNWAAAGHVDVLHWEIPTAAVELSLPNRVTRTPRYVYPRKVASWGTAYEIPADSGIRYRRY